MEMPTRVRVVLLCALASALSYCDRVNISVAVVAMSRELAWSDAEKARVLGGFFWGYFFSQLAGASLTKLYGGKTVLGCAGVAWSVLTVVVPLLARRSVDALVGGRFLLGLAEGVTFPAIYYLLREYVEEGARSRSIAAVSVGTLSGAVFSFMLCPLLIERFGWASVFFVFGLVLGPAFCLAWYHFVPSSSTSSAAGGGGYSHTLATADAEDHNKPQQEPPLQHQQQLPYASMLRVPVLNAVFFAHFTHNLIHFSLQSWLPTFFNEKLNFKGDSLAVSSVPWMFMALAVVASSAYADSLVSRGMDSATVRRYFTVCSFLTAGCCMLIVCALVSTKAGLQHPWWILSFLSLALGANGSSAAAGYEGAKLDLTHSATSASRLQSMSNTLATCAGIVGIPLVSFLKGGGESGWANVFLGLGLCFFAASGAFWVFGRWSGPLL